jgi:hypothetical protein
MFRSIRLGHATNSSSAHSIIFHPGNLDKFAASCPHTSIHEIDEYSRDRFVFSKKREKALYVMHSVGHINMSNHDRLATEQVLRQHDLQGVTEEAQTINMNFEKGEFSNFFREAEGGVRFADWLDMVLSDDVSIVGYDDNYDMPAGTLIAQGIAFEGNGSVKWKKDGNAIIGYSRREGTKIRWSKTDYDKSTTPELVDVKITDYCGYGCDFCYMGSTKEGQHAPLARLEGIFDQLANMGVFEVAIGGGEPAHHPDFAKIIRAATARGLTFNFTAFGLDWLKNDEIISALRETNGIGVGVSIHSSRDVKKIERARTMLRDQSIWGVQMIGQTVVGATPMPTIEKTLDACVEAHQPILLLGFKETGRGVGYKRARVTDANMKAMLLKAKNCAESKDSYQYDSGFHLSVDTCFLDQYGHVLDDLKVPHVLRTSPEGKFSMYIDAVENTCGPSSYCDDAQKEPLGDIKAQFAKY